MRTGIATQTHRYLVIICISFILLSSRSLLIELLCNKIRFVSWKGIVNHANLAVRASCYRAYIGSRTNSYIKRRYVHVVIYRNEYSCLINSDSYVPTR
jgi:hypothetical protein